jgi:hypothetical protein
MIKIVLMTLLAFSLAQASGGCLLAQQGKFNVTWSAYKTPAKIAVSGGFDTVNYSPVAPNGKNFREILVGSKVTIDTQSVNSKLKVRDETLLKYFFKQMKRRMIRAEILDITADPYEKGKPRTGVLHVKLSMNGVSRTVPMSYRYEKGVMRADGYIDLFDFSASKALRSIGKACYDLHEGKTWSDVAIGFSTGISATLCSSKPTK